MKELTLKTSPKRSFHSCLHHEKRAVDKIAQRKVCFFIPMGKKNKKNNRYAISLLVYIVVKELLLTENTLPLVRSFTLLLKNYFDRKCPTFGRITVDKNVLTLLVYVVVKKLQLTERP